MINIALTFDYELFLGENHFSEKEILFDTTEQIMRILESKNIKATFFVDVCSALRYRQMGMNEYVNSMSQQVCDMYRRGFDPQLHIHSNWLKSNYCNGSWAFDTASYRLHTFEDNIGDVVKKGIEYLSESVNHEFPEYKVIAYRAGGYCLQPSSVIVSVLKKEGIQIDSSVAAYSSCYTEERFYDYKDMPKTPNWCIAPNQQWNCSSDSEEGVYEVPVWSIHNPIIGRILHKDRVLFPKDTLKGKYIQTGGASKSNIMKTVFNYITGRTLFSLDALAAPIMWKIIRDLERKYKNAYIAVVSHPKLYGENAFKNLESFVGEATRYNKTVRFVTMRNIYDERISK